MDYFLSNINYQNMKNKIISKKDFFSIKEEFIFNKEKIDLIVNNIKIISPEKYQNYGKYSIIDYAKSVLLKNYFSNTIIELKENIYVKGEDFSQLIRFENNRITQRFIGGLYDINLCDYSGNYLEKKLYAMLLFDFNDNGA